MKYLHTIFKPEHISSHVILYAISQTIEVKAEIPV